MFAKQSRRLKCALIRKNMKLCIVLVIVAAVLVLLLGYVIAAKVFCGGWDLIDCRGGVSSNATRTADAQW